MEQYEPRVDQSKTSRQTGASADDMARWILEMVGRSYMSESNNGDDESERSDAYPEYDEGVLAVFSTIGEVTYHNDSQVLVKVQYPRTRRVTQRDIDRKNALREKAFGLDPVSSEDAIKQMKESAEREAKRLVSLRYGARIISDSTIRESSVSSGQRLSISERFDAWLSRNIRPKPSGIVTYILDEEPQVVELREILKIAESKYGKITR